MKNKTPTLLWLYDNGESHGINSKEAFIDQREYLSDEEMFIQKVKFKQQNRVMKLRRAEIKQYKQYDETKFIIRDRRLAAEDSNPWKNYQAIRSPPQQSFKEEIYTQPIKKAYLRPHSSKTYKDPRLFGGTMQVMPMTAIKRPPFKKNISQVSSPKKESYFDSSDAFQSDAPSRAIKGHQRTNPKQEDMNHLHRMGSWDEDINQEIEKFQIHDNKSSENSMFIGREASEQDINQKMQGVLKKNQSSLLKQMNSAQMRPQTGTAYKRNQVAQKQNFMQSQQQPVINLEVKQITQEKLSSSQESKNPFEVLRINNQNLQVTNSIVQSQPVEFLQISEQLASQQHVDISIQNKQQQTLDISIQNKQQQTLDISIQKTQQQNSDISIQNVQSHHNLGGATIQKQQPNQQNLNNSIHQKDKIINQALDKNIQQNLSQQQNQSQQQNLSQQQHLQVIISQSQTQQQTLGEGIIQNQSQKQSVDVKSQQDVTMKASRQIIIKRRLQSSKEIKQEYNGIMVNKMETYLITENNEYMKLAQDIQTTKDKEKIMIEMNRRRKEQIIKSAMDLEQLQDRYLEQKRQLEEMTKHEENQTKVISVLNGKKLKGQEEYQSQLKTFHAANVIKRYLLFSRDRKAWDNHKLRNNTNIQVLQEFKTVRLQISQKQQTKKSDVVRGYLAVYVDLHTHRLWFKFYLPKERKQIQSQRVAFYHQLDIHELEFYYGKYAESTATRSLIQELLNLILSRQILVDKDNVGLMIDSSKYNNNKKESFHKIQLLGDQYHDYIQLSISVEAIKQTVSILKARDSTLLPEMEIQLDFVDQLEQQYYWLPIDIEGTKQIISQIYRAEDQNLFYKINIISKKDEITQALSYHALLRFYGPMDHIFQPKFHYVLSVQIKDQKTIGEILKRAHELPLYFIIDLENKIFQSRPKAFRIEEIFQIQRLIKNFLQKKRLQKEISKKYLFLLNVVIDHNHNDHKFWVRVYKDLQKQKFFATFETLDLKVFMYNDQKKKSQQFMLDEYSAKKLAESVDPLAFIMVNDRKHTIKLMRLMIEQLKDSDVRRLQQLLRTLVAKKHARTKLKQMYSFFSLNRMTVQNRPLLLRIFQKKDIALDSNNNYILDVCDLVKAKLRPKEYKSRYYAKMVLQKSIVDIALKYKNVSLFFDFNFRDCNVDYTRKIKSIQTNFRQTVQKKLTKKDASNNLTIMFSKTIINQNKKLLMMVLNKVNQNSQKVVYFCSLNQRRKDPYYINAHFDITQEFVTKTMTEKNPQRLYDLDFKKNCVTIHQYNTDKINQIQNYWLRRQTKKQFGKRFLVQFCGIDLYEGQKIFVYLYYNLVSDVRILYCQSLRCGLKLNKQERFKVNLKPIDKSINSGKLIFQIHPVYGFNKIFFDYQMKLIQRLQTWSKKKYMINKYKSQAKQFEFIRLKKIMIQKVPYLFGVYLIKQSQISKIFLVSLQRKQKKLEEKQFYLLETISYLLMRDIQQQQDPFTYHFEIDYKQIKAKLKNLSVKLSPTFVQHQDQILEVQVDMNKQTQQLILSTNSELIKPGYIYLHSFNEKFVNAISNNLIVFLYPLRAFYMPDIQAVYKIQRAFRKIYYKMIQVYSSDKNEEQSIKVSKINWVRWTNISSTQQEVLNQSTPNNIIFPPILLNQSSFDTKSKSLRIELWREPAQFVYSKPACLGKVEIKYEDLANKQSINLLCVEKQSIQQKQKQKHLRLTHIEPIKKYMFIEYLKSGYIFNLSIAIDFSNQNGNNNKNKLSNHYLDPRKKNNYEKGLICLKSIMQYCPQEMARMYGFGADPGNNKNELISDSFPLTYDINNPSVNGFQSVLESYHKAVSLVQPKATINFTQTIQNAISIASNLEQNQSYLALFILSSSENQDLQSCVQLIQSIKGLPISIFVIGIGRQQSNQFINELNTKGVDFVHFHHLPSYAKELQELEQNIMVCLKADFNSYVRKQGLLPVNKESIALKN